MSENQNNNANANGNNNGGGDNPKPQDKGVEVIINRKVFVKSGKAVEPTFDDKGKPTKVVTVSRKMASTWVEAGVAKVKL